MSDSPEENAAGEELERLAIEPAAPPDSEIMTIGDDMLDPDIDFESGMSVFPVVSLILMAACVFGFIAEAVRGALHDLPTLIRVGALSRPQVMDGEVWRLVSAVFLHGSFDHLLGNLIILYILGMACEHGFGSLQFLTLFVGAGVVGSLLSLMGVKPSVGASGAIFGLIGALVTMLWRYRRRLHLRDRRVGVVLLVWAVYQFVLGMILPDVDIRAHLGGFLGGAVLGFVLPPAVLHGRAELAARPLVRVGFVGSCLALLATAVVFLPRLLGA